MQVEPCLKPCFFGKFGLSRLNPNCFDKVLFDRNDFQCRNQTSNGLDWHPSHAPRTPFPPIKSRWASPCVRGTFKICLTYNVHQPQANQQHLKKGVFHGKQIWKLNFFWHPVSPFSSTTDDTFNFSCNADMPNFRPNCFWIPPFSVIRCAPVQPLQICQFTCLESGHASFPPKLFWKSNWFRIPVCPIPTTTDLEIQFFLQGRLAQCPLKLNIKRTFPCNLACPLSSPTDWAIRFSGMWTCPILIPPKFGIQFSSSLLCPFSSTTDLAMHPVWNADMPNFQHIFFLNSPFSAIRCAPFPFQQIWQFMVPESGHVPFPPHQMWIFCVLKSWLAPFQPQQIWKFNIFWHSVCPLSLQNRLWYSLWWNPNMSHFLHSRFGNSCFLQCGHAPFHPKLMFKFTFFKIGLSRVNPNLFFHKSCPGSIRFFWITQSCLKTLEK